MSTEARLLQAIQTGEVLKVAYHGGSNPGAVREIAPIEISGDKVSARCYTSNAVKTFVIARIVVLEGHLAPHAPNWFPQPESEPTYFTLTGFFESNRGVWQFLGWHTELQETQLTLHRTFKSGKPLKTSDVSLNYEEYASDFVVGLDGELREENVRNRPRPWVVRAKKMDTGTFSALDKAAEIFLQHARSLAPNHN